MTAPDIGRGGGLLRLLQDMIAEDGPIGVERYMALALGHPVHGYYPTRDPFGVAGDFTTAPEISQMFGELLGLWVATVWQQMGCPRRCRLVELGPGRGTLMADALRALRGISEARDALDLHLVETSPVLREAQRRTLATAPLLPVWHASVGTVPDGPAIFLANEFFDALPIRQFVRTARGWCERLVGLGETGGLAFGLAPEPDRTLTQDAGLGAMMEIGAVGRGIAMQLAARLVARGGALLIVDYGQSHQGFGDTLQALRHHRFVDPLSTPGEADLTAHVDFAGLAGVAAQAGLEISGPVGQGAFLRTIGLDQRAATLSRSATPSQREAIAAAVERLAGPTPGMGDLFKVLAATPRGQPRPPGFA